MSILTKKKNGSNHKAKTISIPRKKQNMHKTRKNIGKSRKNMGVKTMRGGAGLPKGPKLTGISGAPPKKGFFSKLFGSKNKPVKVPPTYNTIAKGETPFVKSRINPLAENSYATLSKINRKGYSTNTQFGHTSLTQQMLKTSGQKTGQPEMGKTPKNLASTGYENINEFVGVLSPNKYLGGKPNPPGKSPKSVPPITKVMTSIRIPQTALEQKYVPQVFRDLKPPMLPAQAPAPASQSALPLLGRTGGIRGIRGRPPTSAQIMSAPKSPTSEQIAEFMRTAGQRSANNHG